MMMADRIGVMNAGRLEQVATPRQLYEAPNSRRIAEFVGGTNIIDGEVESRDAGRVTVATQAAEQVTAATPALTTDQVCVAIRPEKIRLSRGEATPDAGHAAGINRLEGVISGISYLGGQTRYQSGLIAARCCPRRLPTTFGGRLTPTIRRSAWWCVSRQTIAWCLTDERTTSFLRSRAQGGDCAVSVDVAVFLAAVRLRAQDQPVTHGDGAATLSARV
jgi:hypothetical protein